MLKHLHFLHLIPFPPSIDLILQGLGLGATWREKTIFAPRFLERRTNALQVGAFILSIPRVL